MKVIALLPVRNEAWVLPHSLACFSAFCDVILVCDQGSDDGTLAVCATFPKVVVVPQRRAVSETARLPQHGRWLLLDAARNYDGDNLLWNLDADEVISPQLVNRWRADPATPLKPKTFFDCGYYQLWNSPFAYRDDGSIYGPQLKTIAYVDDRILDFNRSADAAPLHEPRVPHVANSTIVDSGGVLPVLHMQWLLPQRNQMKQAWYRAIELLDGRRSAARINYEYAHTLLPRAVRTTPVPPDWLEGLTFPDFSVDREPAWQQRELYALFDRHGIEFFEPLEIWHIESLAREFRLRNGRRPRSDRSYRAGWPQRARSTAWSAMRRYGGALRRRVFKQ